MKKTKKKKPPAHTMYCSADFDMCSMDPYKVQKTRQRTTIYPGAIKGRLIIREEHEHIITTPKLFFRSPNNQKLKILDYSKCKIHGTFDLYLDRDELKYYNQHPGTFLNDLQQYYITGADLKDATVYMDIGDNEEYIQKFKLDDRAIIVNRFTDIQKLPQIYQTRLAILQCYPALQYVPDIGMRVTNSFFFVLCKDKRISWERLQNCYKTDPVTALGKLDNRFEIPLDP